MGPSYNRLFGRSRTAATVLRLSFLALAAICAGVLILSQWSKVRTQEYSAYTDPDKTALAVILSEEGNAREFQGKFGLSDGEMEEVLAAVREENEKLAKERAESEKIVLSNKSLPDGEIADKISASDYDETVEDAIEETKDSVTTLLAEEDEPQLKGWVDEQWRQEVEAAAAGDLARTTESKAGRGLVCKVWATQYIGYTRYEAALPHRGLKFGPQPRVTVSRNGRGIRPRVKEVGPWNTYDNYWQTRKKRTMWKRLPRCRPEAQAAYYSNFNGGKDEFGRQVLNPAGVDLTPAAARGLNLRKYASGWVYVRFAWVRR